MLAMLERASSFCAREMRGTLSMASTVALRAASACMSSGFCAGHTNDTNVLPGFMSVTSDSDGGRTLNTTSAPAHNSAAEPTMVAPAAR